MGNTQSVIEWKGQDSILYIYYKLNFSMWMNAWEIEEKRLMENQKPKWSFWKSMWLFWWLIGEGKSHNTEKLRSIV